MRVGADVVSTAGLGADAVGGLDLHFEEASGDVDDEIVALAVSPGLATPKPREAALARKAASPISPRRLVSRGDWSFSSEAGVPSAKTAGLAWG